MRLTAAERKWVQREKESIIESAMEMFRRAQGTGIDIDPEAYKNWSSYRMIRLIERLNK
jgi:hypothetical protein